MPNTRASTRRGASRRKLREDTESAGSEDDLNNAQLARGGTTSSHMSIVDSLRNARSGVEKLCTQLRSLEQENANMKAELQQARQNADNGAGRTRQKASRREMSLERTIVDLKAAREKDRRIIEKLRETEVKRDAEELGDVEEDETLHGQQSTDLGDNAVQLLRRVCDTIDMNTLAEEEQCDICMEDMQLGKCYSLPCRHPLCVECFERLCNGPNTTGDHDPGSVQCPHCRAVCQRDECEIITHTAVQQWDVLLEISQQWAKMDVGEMDVGEDDDDKGSLINDGSVAAVESPRIPETAEEAVDLDSENTPSPTSPNDRESVAYKSLSSPLKRKRLKQLVAQRAVRQRM